MAVLVAAVSFGSCGGANPQPVAGPSQTSAAARRDGVVPELAALKLSVRSKKLASLRTTEGTWVVSDATEALVKRANGGTGAFGDETGTYGVDFIGPTEYGEILLLGHDGKIRRAYPMPGEPPHWLYATDDAVFGGRMGDGCLPNSTLFRIDRTSLKLSLIVFPFGDGEVTLLPAWRLASQAETALLPQLVGAAAGVEVISSNGPQRVDIDGVAKLFEDDRAVPPAERKPGSC